LSKTSFSSRHTPAKSASRGKGCRATSRFSTATMLSPSRSVMLASALTSGGIGTPSSAEISFHSTMSRCASSCSRAAPRFMVSSTRSRTSGAASAFINRCDAHTRSRCLLADRSSSSDRMSLASRLCCA